MRVDNRDKDGTGTIDFVRKNKVVFVSLFYIGFEEVDEKTFLEHIREDDRYNQWMKERRKKS